MPITISAGPGGKVYDTVEEVLADAKTVGIHIAANGEDISDLIPKAETHEVIWARFNGKLKSPKKSDDK